MNSSKFRFTLDLHSSQSQYSIPVMYGDTSVTLLINITDGGVPYRIEEGCYAGITIKRPRGTEVNDVCMIRNNTVIEYHFEEDGSTCAEEGIHSCDITLFDGKGARIGSPWFTMVVNKKVERSDNLEVSLEDRTLLDSIAAEEVKRREAEEVRDDAEIARDDAEKKRVQAEEERTKADRDRAERFESVKEYADRSEKAALSVEGYGEKIILNDKRVTNLEKGYSDDLFVTGSTNSAGETAVPANALPYAEVKTLAGAYTYTSGKIYPKKPMRIESCKRAEKRKLDLTLDISEMSPNMTVEKLADGSFKFNGYTTFQGNGAACKFATVTLPKGRYGINYKVVSGSSNSTINIAANGTSISVDADHINGVVTIGDDNTTLVFTIEHEGSFGYLEDYVLSFEIQEGDLSGYEFVGKLLPIATLEIPEKIRAIDGYGLYDNYLDFENKRIVVIRKLNEDGSKMPTLPTPEYIDVSEYLGDDNLIEVAPGGVLRVIQDTGEQMTANRNIVFMLKGV